MEVNLTLTSKLYEMNKELSISQPVSKTHKQMQYWNGSTKS